MALRRDFDLLPRDERFLEEYGHPWETIADGSQWVLIYEFPTHDGYNPARVTAAIRMETGYPNAELHMVYFFPALVRKDGRPIGKTEAKQVIDGRRTSAGRVTAQRRIRGGRVSTAWTRMSS